MAGRRKDRERDIQRWIVRALPSVLPPGSVVHSSDIADRDPRRIVRAKWMGAVTGWPDVTICLPGGLTCLVELKKRSGGLSPAQRETHERLAAVGHDVILAKTADDLREGLAARLGESGSAAAWDAILADAAEYDWRRKRPRN